MSQVPQDPRTTFHNTTGCQNPTFQVIVEDEDLADQIRSRWFIGSTTSQPFQSGNVTTTGTQRRSVSAPTANNFNSTLANLGEGTEVLTVYVADTEILVIDGQISLEPRAERVLPDNTTAIDKGSFDTFTWTLDVRKCQ